MATLRNVDWLCEVLDVSRQRAYALIRSGLVPCVRLGRSVRVDPDAMQSLRKDLFKKA